MKLSLKVILIICAAILTSCASVKLSDSYVSDQFEDAKTKKILVVARSKDMDVRNAYENTLITKLKAKGIDAVSALNLFPDLKEKVNRTEDEKNIIVNKFKKAGIQTIMLLVLKDTKVQQSQPEIEKEVYIPNSQKGKYGISFMDYYDVNSVAYLTRNLKPNYNDSEESIEPLLKSTT